MKKRYGNLQDENYVNSFQNVLAWQRERRFVEQSWYETYTHKGVAIHFVPAKHWTRRLLWDTNTSHWGGFVLESSEHKTIYFAGDSGYFQEFQDIGARYDIHTALLPIGAYEPDGL